MLIDHQRIGERQNPCRQRGDGTRVSERTVCLACGPVGHRFGDGLELSSWVSTTAGSRASSAVTTDVHDSNAFAPGTNTIRLSPGIHLNERASARIAVDTDIRDVDAERLGVSQHRRAGDVAADRR